MFRCLTVGEARGEHWWPGPQLRPWEVRKLTVSEAAAMILDRDGLTRSGRQPMNDMAIEAYIAWYRNLGPLERVQRARAGTL